MRAILVILLVAFGAFGCESAPPCPLKRQFIIPASRPAIKAEPGHTIWDEPEWRLLEDVM